MKERRDPMMTAILADIEHMLTQGRMDMPLSLCFAANRGDDLLLRQLLKKGMDPNESDSSGRTVLVRLLPILQLTLDLNKIYV